MQERLSAAPRLLRALVRLLRGIDRHETAQRQRQLVFGLIGLAGAALLLAVCAVTYVLPLGKHTYSAALEDARSVRVGEDVRIAGITVGKVVSLDLRSDSVFMRFTVEDAVFLGEHTTLDIRMLTAIGGHYVAVVPAGEHALGAATISADHVRLPYNLADALRDAQRPLTAVDGETLRRNISAVSAALDRSPGSLQAMTDALVSVVDVMNRQNADVNQALDVADEYLSMLGRSRGVIGAMLTKIGAMETTVLGRQGEVIEALRVVSELLSRLAAVEPAWRVNLEPLADKLVETYPELERLGARLGDVAGAIGGLGTRLKGLAAEPGPLTIDQSGTTLTVPDLCIPLPGRGC
ncbi:MULTISPECIES: MlaD family protein [unclassified Nocardia]|uniref:MlaD family protein n=1 Tax=unclassified Nocardia TaxID=2637762 RepID=UPI0030E5DAD9